MQSVIEPATDWIFFARNECDRLVVFENDDGSDNVSCFAYVSYVN